MANKITLKKILFRNKNEADPEFPTGYEPLDADNLNKFQDDFETSVNEFLDTFQEAYDTKFNEWFETVKNKLDGDVATRLTNEIDGLKEQIKSLETKIQTLEDNTLYYDVVEEIE